MNIVTGSGGVEGDAAVAPAASGCCARWSMPTVPCGTCADALAYCATGGRGVTGDAATALATSCAAPGSGRPHAGCAAAAAGAGALGRQRLRARLAAPNAQLHVHHRRHEHGVQSGCYVSTYSPFQNTSHIQRNPVRKCLRCKQDAVLASTAILGRVFMFYRCGDNEQLLFATGGLAC